MNSHRPIKLSPPPSAPKAAQAVHALFLKKGWTLALAESCTGGLLSWWLTQKPRASGFFLGSVVGYSYQAKQISLNIPPKILQKQGAVNAHVCQLMAQGVKNLWKSDWGLSVTGVAGPGRKAGDPPVGVVFAGLSGPGGQEVKRLELMEKNRFNIQQKAALFALDFLYSGIK